MTDTSPSDTAELFARLENHYRECGDLNSALALLSWDQETYMPARGAEARARHLKTLSGLAHRHFTAPVVRELLDGLKGREGDLDSLKRRAVAELERDYERKVRIPESLVAELAETQSHALEAWKIARDKSRFEIFAPHLEALLGLRRRIAEIWGYDATPYDALHDAYERGGTAARLRPLFARLRERLVPLLTMIREAQGGPTRALLRGRFPLEAQWTFTERVLHDMGFDFEAGRQDKSVHPFSSGIARGDTRLTTRLRGDDFAVGIGGTIHEGGHGLYEQGLSEERVGVILAEATSLGIHESQSRLWENLVGKSRPFWQHYHPVVAEAFPKAFGACTDEELYRALNVVEPTLVRVEADEVTYNLHVLLRFELELAMVEGDLATADLPARWDDKCEEYLGIRPRNDAEGCLQDIHWAFGMFGYFPTYTLGNLYSVPFYQAAQRAIPELATRIDPGILRQLKEWLNGQIHASGRSETADEISRRVTGGPVTPEPFLDYLEAKYADIYGLGG